MAIEFLITVLIIILLAYYNSTTKTNFYEIDGVSYENGYYYAIMRNNMKTCKYKMRKLNDVNSQILIDLIGINEYSKRFKLSHKEYRYSFTTNGEYCVKEIEI